MRRSRWTVETDIGKRVILAYDAMGAQNYYTGRGHAVYGVTKGDYRMVPKPGGSFKVNQKALADALEVLKLKLPVKIRTHARQGATNGNHRLSREGYHDIMVKSYLTPEEASSTLWHELTHAQQAENAGGVDHWNKVCNDQRRRYPYSRRPIEVEARAMSELMSDVLLTGAI